MDVFDLYAKISLDTSGYEKNLSNAKSLFASAGKSISASTVAMGTMIAHGLERAAASIINLGKSAVTSSAEVRAETAQFEAAFGELQAAAEGAFAGIEQDTGVLSTRLRTVGTKAFSQFKGAGLDAASALSEMDKYTRLAADAAAYYDMSIEDADERLRSFLRGNTEAGDMIGLFTSETQRNNKALETYGAKWLELTEAQKQMLMLDIADEIYQQSGAIGQASREADGWANVTGNLKEAWRQLLGVVGTPFMDGLTPVLQKLTEFFSDETVQMRIGMLAANIGNLAGEAFDGVIGFLDKLIGLSEGTESSETFENIKDFLSNLYEFAGVTFDSATEFFKTLFGVDSAGEALENISKFFDDVAGFLSENSEAAIALIAAITGLMLIKNPFALFITALTTIITNWDDIKEKTESAEAAIEKFFGLDAPEGFLGGVISVLSGIIGLIGTATEKLYNFLNLGSSAGSSEGYEALIQQGFQEGGFWGGVGAAIENAWWNPFKPSYGGTPGFGGGASSGNSSNSASFATGLNYVPYNNFAANLHAGEAVLNRADATAWRAGGMAQPVDYATLGAVVGEAVRAALVGVAVEADGNRIGELTSRSIAQNAWRRRYTT